MLLAAAAMAFTHPGLRRRAAFEIRVRTAPAPFDFRGNDRDGSKVHDFWTADVGMFAPTEEGSDELLKLIEISIADAHGRGGTGLDAPTQGVVQSPAPRPAWDIID